jgi:hypothetical protein
VNEKMFKIVYPANYKRTEVEIRPAKSKLYCVYSKAGKLLYPNGFRRNFRGDPEWALKNDEEGAHIKNCESWIKEHSRISAEIRPSEIEKFCVYHKETGELLYPNYSNTELEIFGKHKDECENWIGIKCAGSLDKPFLKKFLRKLTKLKEGYSLDDVSIIKNELMNEGERHADYQVIFKQGEGYYRFYYFVCLGGLGIGIWHSNTNEIDKNTHLCRRVSPKKKVVVTTEFVGDPYH